MTLKILPSLGRPSDFFKFANSVVHLNKFHLTPKNGLFLPIFCHFHTKIMLTVAVLLLCGSFLPGELFLIQFQRYVLTGSSVSNSLIPLRFPVKMENHWFPLYYIPSHSSNPYPYIGIVE